MTGKEWVETLSELGDNVWEQAALPTTYWNEGEAGFTKSNVRMPALFSGAADGGINMVSDYPQLIKMGYDVATKSEVRQGLWNGIKNISPSKVADFATGAVKQKWENYNFSDKPYMGKHELGYDAVGVVKMVAAGGLVAGLKDVGEKFGKKAIAKYGKNFLEKLKKANLSSIEKEIAEESYDILNNENFDKIINAFKKNQSVEIEINGRVITYDDAPFSGLTNFEKNGFHIGREAFKDDDEIIKTVLHEMHRLKTSKLRGSGNAADVAQETKAAFDYAEKGIDLFK